MVKKPDIFLFFESDLLCSRAMPYVTHDHLPRKKKWERWPEMKVKNQASLHYRSRTGIISPPFYKGSLMTQAILARVRHAPLVKPWWLAP